MIDPEYMIDSAIATLRAELPMRITAVNAEAGASLQLLTPSTTDGFLFAGKDPIVSYPSVEVAIADVNLSNFDVSRYMNGDASTPLIVAGWVQDNEKEALMRRAYRYGRALGMVMLQDDAAGSGTRPTTAVFRFRPTDPDTRQGDAWTAAALLIVTYESTVTNQAP